MYTLSMHNTPGLSAQITYITAMTVVEAGERYLKNDEHQFAIIKIEAGWSIANLPILSLVCPLQAHIEIEP
jgi:hypothetical protein